MCGSDARACLKNLRITADQAEDGETKHKGVVAALNAAYWGGHGNTANRLLIAWRLVAQAEVCGSAWNRGSDCLGACTPAPAKC